MLGDDFASTDLAATIRALPEHKRDKHLSALACVLHLIEDCKSGRFPSRFILGREAYGSVALRWAVRAMGFQAALCATCGEDAVTLLTMDRAGQDCVHTCNPHSHNPERHK